MLVLLLVLLLLFGVGGGYWHGGWNGGVIGFGTVLVIINIVWILGGIRQ